MKTINPTHYMGDVADNRRCCTTSATWITCKSVDLEGVADVAGFIRIWELGIHKCPFCLNGFSWFDVANDSNVMWLGRHYSYCPLDRGQQSIFLIINECSPVLYPHLGFVLIINVIFCFYNHLFFLNLQTDSLGF